MSKSCTESIINELKKETRPNRKEELSHLLRFANIFPNFPDGRCDFEKPDLQIHTSTQVLGIEHTRILRQPIAGEVNLRSQERLQDKIVARAHQLHDENGGPQLWVYVDFNVHTVLDGKSKNEIAVQLAATVNDIDYLIGEERAQNRWWDVEGWRFKFHHSKDFPFGIDTIHLKYVNKPGLVLWDVPRGTVVPQLTTMQIQQRIDEKQNELSSYRSKCDKMWLLLVTDGGIPSSYFQLSPDVASISYKSGFDRVFYFDSFSTQIIEFSIEP